MIETLISSKTRIKLLLKFFLNSDTTGYLRSLENEFGDSSNSIRIELNRLEKAGLLKTSSSGNKKIFKANTLHPLYSEIHNILLKHIGLDQVIETVIERLGDVEKVFLTGTFSKGINSQIIDLIFIGNIEKDYLWSLIEKVEKLIKRKIRYIIYQNIEEVDWNAFQQTPFILWSKS
jgi:predicted transcriptional regulator